MRIARWTTEASDTLRMCNTYCLSTATLVTRTRLSVALYVRCLFCVTCVSLVIFLCVSVCPCACYHSVQNLLSSRLLSKNLKIETYITIILPVVLYGCETWSLTLREERKLRVFENRTWCRGEYLDLGGTR